MTIAVRALCSNHLQCPLNISLSGLFANALGGAMYFGRAPDKKGILSNEKDTTPGPNAPHYEIIFGVSSRSIRLRQPRSDDFFVVALGGILEPWGERVSQ